MRVLNEQLNNKNMSRFNTNQAAKAQSDLCAVKGYPHFAPYSGVCWSCKRNIFQEIDRGKYKTGISVKQASSTLITGCPHCNRTYCD